MLLYILGILIIVIGLALSIGLHEIGHLVPAKLFGVKVTQYMVGFGKTLWSRKKGETEYGVKAIPLGGYIAMIGMFPPKGNEKARASSTGFLQSMSDDRPEILRRRGPAPVAVDGPGEAEPAEETRRRLFDGLVQDARDSSAETIGEGEDARSFYRLAVWKRIIVMLGGPAMNLVLAFVFMAILVMGFGIAQPSTTVGVVNACVVPAGSTATECDDSFAETPAAAAGLRPGDHLVSLGGTPLSAWDQTTEIIRTSPGKTLPLEIERAGEPMTLSITPLLTERYVYDKNGVQEKNPDGSFRTEEVGFIGMSPTNEAVRGGLSDVAPMVGNNVSAVFHMIINLPDRLVGVAKAAFGAGERDPNGPMSVVGVGRIAGELVSMDSVSVSDKAATLVGLLGSLNVALFAFNLIPLMPLDGGHVVAAAWEGIRRFFAKLFGRPDPGPVDAAKLIPLTMVIALLLGGMTVLLIFADLVNPIQLFK